MSDTTATATTTNADARDADGTGDAWREEAAKEAEESQQLELQFQLQLFFQFFFQLFFELFFQLFLVVVLERQFFVAVASRAEEAPAVDARASRRKCESNARETLQYDILYRSLSFPSLVGSPLAPPGFSGSEGSFFARALAHRPKPHRPTHPPANTARNPTLSASPPSTAFRRV